MQDKKVNLISGQRLARNIFWNLLGAGAPLLVAIVAIPLLIEGLGIMRFGVLTITWMVVGYFSLFDLGLGRALTKLVAEKLGKGLDKEIPNLFWTALLLMLVLGVLGGLFIATLSSWLVSDVLNIPSDLQHETLVAFYLLAASIPIIISSTGLQGVLEAHQRFGLVNAVRIPLGVSTFLGPVLALSFSHSLVPVVAVLVIARLLSWFAFAALCLHVEPALRHSVSIDKEMFKPLISFGGWMTVSNIISPFMVNMDRFLIGATLTMTAVSYYATPYEVVSRLLIVPGALMGVMFPAFATTLMHDRGHAASLYSKTIKYIFLLLFPAVLLIVMFAREGLNLWLGNEFADNSSLVLQILAMGVFLNAHANVPFGLVQSAGRPDLTAKLHLVELPFYLLLLWGLLSAYGIVGVALAWLLRVAVDTTALFVMANRLVATVSGFTLRVFYTAGIALICLVISALISSLTIRFFFLFLILALFAVTAWFVIFSEYERSRIRDYLTK
jgi:O-antigen/teichoic acid export membrane protein